MLLVDALGGVEAIAIAAALCLVIGLVGLPSRVPCLVGVLGEVAAMLASTFDFFLQFNTTLFAINVKFWMMTH